MAIEPHIRALIFDCDGTLADTMPLHYEAWQETMAPLGSVFPTELFYRTAGMQNSQIVGLLNNKLGLQLDPQTIAADKESRFERKLSAVRPVEPVVALAKKYRRQMPMAVGSGGELPMITKILASIGMDNFFDTVVTAEQVPHGKPAPDIFLEAARRMNIEPQYCQVFEDADSGLEAARQAGMAVFDVRLWVKSKLL